MLKNPKLTEKEKADLIAQKENLDRQNVDILREIEKQEKKVLWNKVVEVSMDSKRKIERLEKAQTYKEESLEKDLLKTWNWKRTSSN